MNETKWDVLNSERVVDNPYVSVRRDRVRLPPNESGGRTELDWYVMEGSDSVCIFALTPAREVVLIRHYRHPLGRWVYELPAGGIMAGATAQATGIAELAEETGWRATALEEVGCFEFQPAHSARRLYAFYTDSIIPGPRLYTEAAEAGIETLLVPIPRLIQMLQAGEITGMPSVVTIQQVLTAKNLWTAA